MTSPTSPQKKWTGWETKTEEQSLEFKKGD